MASNSSRRSASSGRSPDRRTVHISPPKAHRGPPAGTAAPKRESAEIKARRTERDRRAEAQRLVVRLRRVAFVAAVLLAVWAVAAVYSSDFLEVDRVFVEGNERLTAERVDRIAQFPKGATLLRFPAREVEQRLEADPWILSASVSRAFPNGARIRVEERVPVALVDDGKASFWLVAADGFVIARRTAEDTGTLLVVRDVERLEVATGTVTTSKALLNALKIVSGISPELRSIVRMVSAPTVDKTAVYTTDDVEIFFGDAEDLARKDASARQILAEQAGKVVYINVRSVQRPTWRGLGDAP